MKILYKLFSENIRIFLNVLKINTSKFCHKMPSMLIK
jgi:hypothetical protein